MAIDFEALSQYYKSLSMQRKIEMFLLLALVIFGFICGFIMLNAFQNTKQENSVNAILLEQNKELKKNNVDLTHTIETIGKSIAERNQRDSISMAQVDKNTAMSNDLNKQISQINQKYDKAIFNANTTDADILEYLRSERISSQN